MQAAKRFEDSITDTKAPVDQDDDVAENQEEENSRPTRVKASNALETAINWLKEMLKCLQQIRDLAAKKRSSVKIQII
ncbi:hypothetical protein FQA39_LY19216 [Lamprigera yunnana]|nr:hypothetical protein FQA39_LY19216 [Lamprigera yunnana]